MTFEFKDFKQSAISNSNHYAVVGHPIGHSLSPLMHQTALNHYQMEARYIALDVDPSELSSFITWCNEKSFLGCNVTIPYKRQLLDAVDELDEIASKLKVINTIHKEDGSLKGYNTDLHGFLQPLNEFQDVFEPDRAIIFGTGGASMAVLHGLQSIGFQEVIFISRNPRNHEVINHHIAVEVVDYSQWTNFADEASLIVNTTPLGMFPNVNESPVRESESPFLADKICYDLVYNPIKTKFLKQAERENAIIINGLEMLIQQGNKSFEIWTGKTFPLNEVRQTLLNKFQK
ncbi:MAG: shikimate dehydrogenase [Balneolaceae bacterium]|nr:shikimate dehydrogenase [Balneolaceae bacterium]